MANDEHAQTTPKLLADLAAGLRLYSILPVPFLPHGPLRLSAIAPIQWLTSLIVCAPAALALALGIALQLPAFVVALLAVAALTFATGAITEDALSDCFDGFGGHGPENILAIMRDAHHGTYGLSALVFFILIRVAVLALVIGIAGFGAIFALLGIQVVARTSSLILPTLLPPAASNGMGATAGRVTGRAMAVSAISGGAVSLVLLAPLAGWLGALAILVSGAVAGTLWTANCRRRLGGHTGDLIGGGQALSELACWLVLCVFV